MCRESVRLAMTLKVRVRANALRSNSQAMEVDSQIAIRIGCWLPFPLNEESALNSFIGPFTPVIPSQSGTQLEERRKKLHLSNLSEIGRSFDDPLRLGT